ncbi:MAG: serine/threonine protein kinase [Rhodothermaceae bacterium]|nr:serine/threonine protein kinase [Rhodothermaceae bacterium]
MLDDLPAHLHRVDPLYSEPGQRIGPYRIVHSVGEGGMGEVVLGERADGAFAQTVALKLVKPGMDTRAVIRRFEAERQILAQLNHPSIAKLLDGGTTGQGRPWFAMEYVEGEPITAYCQQRGSSLEVRLALFEQVCAAVAHAHARLVVHRDLKPSNVLVTEEEGAQPRVKLLDFGIAKVLGADDDLLLTATGVRPMTRAYAAPEQLRGEPVTTATDVYALGILLYELLTGRRPFEASTAPQLEQQILSREPTRPSALGPSTDAAGPAEEAHPASHHLRGDLDAICLVALRKDPAERYATVEALLVDIQRHREGLPIAARPPSAGYRLRKFAQRHRAGVSAAAAAALLLLAFAVTVAVQQRATAHERDTATATADFLEALFAAADPLAEERQDTLQVRELLDRGLDRARLQLADAPEVRARLFHTIGRAYLQIGVHQKAYEPLQEAVALLREADDPARLADALLALSAALISQEKPEDAERHAREALALAEHLNDQTLRASAENWVGASLLFQSRPEEGEALLRASVGRLRAVNGADDPEAYRTEHTLARALVDQGKLDEADSIFTAHLAYYSQTYGPDSPHRIGTLRVLTFLYLITGRLEEADEIGAEAVAYSREARPGSGTLAEMLALYAAVARRQGRFDEAEALLREALAIPPLSPESQAIPYGTLASVLYEQGNLAGAVEAQQRSLDLLRTSDSPSMLFSTVKLAGYLRELRRFAEAERLLLDTHTTQVNATSSEQAASSHMPSDQLIAELIALYEAWGRPDEAAAWRAQRPG